MFFAFFCCFFCLFVPSFVPPCHFAYFLCTQTFFSIMMTTEILMDSHHSLPPSHCAIVFLISNLSFGLSAATMYHTCQYLESCRQFENNNLYFCLCSHCRWLWKGFNSLANRMDDYKLAITQFPNATQTICVCFYFCFCVATERHSLNFRSWSQMMHLSYRMSVKLNELKPLKCVTSIKCAKNRESDLYIVVSIEIWKSTGCKWFGQ